MNTDHHKSWVSPDARRAPRLLFVSDIATNDVYILTMPAMALKGTLTDAEIEEVSAKVVAQVRKATGAELRS